MTKQPKREQAPSRLKPMILLPAHLPPWRIWSRLLLSAALLAAGPDSAVAGPSAGAQQPAPAQQPPVPSSTGAPGPNSSTNPAQQAQAPPPAQQSPEPAKPVPPLATGEQANPPADR